MLSALASGLPCAVVWNADPVLFSLGPLSVRWYSLAFAIGFTVGYALVSRMFRHEGAPERWLGSLLIYVVVATVVGARLGHVFFYEWDYYSVHPEKILRIGRVVLPATAHDRAHHRPFHLVMVREPQAGLMGVRQDRHSHRACRGTDTPRQPDEQ